jgi:hypothetical protein
MARGTDIQDRQPSHAQDHALIGVYALVVRAAVMHCSDHRPYAVDCAA